MKARADEGGSLWAITSYFNPVGYRSRLRNYRIFRQRLGVPLITVEWSRDGRFELHRSDADILIQLDGGDILWQKERLLNVALRAVPESCRNVAWVDCDVVFGSPDWAQRTEALLDHALVVQLFESLVDAPPEMSLEDASWLRASPSAISDVARAAREKTTLEDLQPSTVHAHRLWLSGLAWAARREWLQAHGFYDVCVVGGGDRVMSCAIFGQLASAASVLKLGDRWEQHYMEWAGAFHADLRGAVTYMPGTLFHLWHGDLRDRRYGVRRDEFSRFDFDPYRDLALESQGCWRWNTEKPQMHAYVQRYFEARNEDGVYPHHVAR